MNSYSRTFTLMLCSLAAVLGLIRVASAQQQNAITDVERLGGHIYRDANNEVEIISFENGRVTDSDLAILTAFPKLRSLDLDNTEVTDEAFDHLLKLPALEEVSLRRTQVTREAATRFKDQHPGVYHVELSRGFQPSQLAFAGIIIFPMLIGAWLIRMTRRKRDVLAPRIYARGLLWGYLLMVGSLLLMLVAIVQAAGVDFQLADLFG